MSLFAIGDTHLSFGTDKPMNIFRGWDNYVERLSKNWRNIITDEDTVVVAGDISWSMSLENALEDLKFIDSLPGKKLLMKGNHDYWWETKTKMEKFFENNGLKTLNILHNNAYFADGFAVCGTRGWFYDDSSPDAQKVILREAGRLRTSIKEAKKLGGEVIAFLHYPPVSEQARCDEIYNVLVEEGVKRCCYAHLHSASIRKAVTGDYESINFSLISGDYLEFYPKKIY